MAGNVWEWCLNRREKPEQLEAVGVDKEIGRRVVRGGSWYDVPVLLRASSRTGTVAGNRNFDLGFRLVQDIP